MKRRKLGIVILSVLIGVSIIWFVCQEALAPKNDSNDQNSSQSQKNSNNSANFDKNKYSIDDPNSIWVAVNKQRPLPLIFEPDDLITPNVQLNPSKSAEENTLRKETAKAVEALFIQAAKQGYSLMLASGYRSSDLQKTYYDSYVAKDGQAAADRYSARPGTSEHQTGLSLDIARKDRHCYLEICFGDTAEGKWLAKNAYKYGLALRYPEESEQITGYQYEPWHFRYVGLDLARELTKTNQTMEEFFNLR